jgi:riboflavin synthase alpha subunit
VTASETTLGAKKPGDAVNLEGDVVGKYIAKAADRPSLTEEKLAAAGFIG